ncbi:MAG: hypothetical protein A3F13_09905 [Gammaproteobacteria bacterium RIFCSPHIGHO2_12_FULL_40_19]|nr:MAG: hypothetical protein A3F13_09905 [Gammaproteobacteria bacterium RIFCSPHIGHO2_12_FULL_40_19]
MGSQIFETMTVNNVEAPFTELFSLLKHCEMKGGNASVLVYELEELRVILQHTDNAMNILLQGLQGVGQAIGIASRDDGLKAEQICQIGFFISAITNLTEALNSLRMNTCDEIEVRGELGSVMKMHD